MAVSGTPRHLFAVCAVLVLVFLFVPGSADAGFFDVITSPFKTAADSFGAIANLVSNIIVFIGLLFTGIPIIFGIAAALSYAAMAILALVSAGLFAVLKPLILATLSIAVVPSPEAVNVVQEGWQFSRDFVNLLFIIILAVIGLGTILRLQNYQLQKTLPTLIIIALLVNFSGVLVGFVVDIANLITAAFLKQIAVTDVITGPLTAARDTLLSSIREIPEKLFEDPITFFTGTFVAPVLDAAAKAIFFLGFLLVLLAILVLFVVRVGILWILTILAPFAFAAYILPATRSFWEQWWKNLIQWAFMGVPMAFFLFLAMAVASISIDLGVTSETIFGDLLITLLQPIFVLLFLIIGFFLSLSFVPAGAQQALRVGGKLGTKGGLAVSSAIGRRVSPKVAQAGKALRERGEAAMPQGRGVLGRLGRAAGPSAIAKWAGRGLEFAGETTKGAVEQRDEGEISKAKEDIAKMPLSRQKRALKNALFARNKNKAIGAIEAIDPEDVDDMIRDGEIEMKDLTGIRKELTDRGAVPHRREFDKRFLHRQKDLGISAEEKEEALDRYTAADLEKISKYALDTTKEEGREFVEDLAKNLDPQMFPQLLRRKKKERQAIWNHLKGQGAEWFVDNNREDLLQWAATSPAARNMGLSPVETKGGKVMNSVEDVRNLVQQMRPQQAPFMDPAEATQRIADLQAQSQQRQRQIDRKNQDIRTAAAAARQARQANNLAQARVHEQEANTLRQERQQLQKEQAGFNREAQNLTDTMGQLQKEQDFVGTIRRARKIPPQEARETYVREYRSEILNQLGKEGPLIQRLAQSRFSRNADPEGAARNARMQELFNKAQAKQRIPESATKPSARDLQEFRTMAEQGPDPNTTYSREKIAGAMRTALEEIEKLETGIAKVAGEIKEKQDKGQQVTAQERRNLNDLYKKTQQYQKNLGALNKNL